MLRKRDSYSKGRETDGEKEKGRGRETDGEKERGRGHGETNTKKNDLYFSEIIHPQRRRAYATVEGDL